MNQSEAFCGEIWDSSQRFITEYFYGCVKLVLEPIGIPLSILTIIVFSKNPLSSSNILFISLAISDLMVLVLGIPQSVFRIMHKNIHYQLDRGCYTDIEKYADHFLFTGQKIFYNVSLSQTMILAVWRYIAVTHPLKERVFCSVKTTRICIVSVYVICFLLDAPTFLLNPPTINGNDELFADHKNIVWHLLYILVFRIIPCTMVSICTVRFIRVLQESKTRRKEIIPNFNKDWEEKEKLTNRTTKVVLCITIFFLANNATLAIIRILKMIFGSEFEKNCLPAITCISHLFVLIYTIIPFVVYYSTSQQFRDTFKSLLPSFVKDICNTVSIISKN